MQIFAPWTEEQVASLNEFQTAGFFHEFTCGADDCREALVAYGDGWRCPRCDYRQDWAHDYMVDGSWRKHLSSFRDQIMRNLLVVFLAFFPFMVGCGLQLEISSEEIPPKQEVQSDTPPEQSDIKRETDEKIEQLNILRSADQLVEQWADGLERRENRGFDHFEGIPDLDPWGNLLEIEYNQSWLMEYAKVSSAGPDGISGTKDDIVRTREAWNPLGVHRGIGSFGKFMIAYVLAIPFAVMAIGLLRPSKAKDGQSRRRKIHPILLVLAAPFLGVFALVLTVAFLLGSLLGIDADGFDLPDFDLFD